MVKQVGLLAAGCQPWNNDMCAASGDRFAYCATLAIYIYQLDKEFNEFKLISIMSQHKKTITAIAWNPRNPDLIASASSDKKLIIWNVAEQKAVAVLENTKEAPVSIGWYFGADREGVCYIYGRGPLYMWTYNSGAGLSTFKEAQGFSSDVCQFRWHPKKAGKLVFGHNNGSISVCNVGSRGQHKHVLRPEGLEDSDEDDPVTTLEWDYLSTDYLLMTNAHNGIRLVDTLSLLVIMKFHLPSAASQVHCLSWVHSAPGMFVTGDTTSGILRLWNVSKPTPIENIRLKKTGFHALQAVCNSAPEIDEGEDSSPSSDEDHVSSTSQAQAPAMMTSTHFALPPAQIVCTFLDGGVGLYDLGRRKWNFLRDQGHIETIFDCEFNPDDPDLLATASFDGTIKVWDINTLTAVQSSPGNEGVIYSISWAPADLNCIVASTSKNGLFIWDITKGKVIKRFNEHGRSPVFNVAWNRKDSRRIMSAGGDGYCVVRQVDGQLLQKYKHPGPVFGCDWSPNNKDMLATGCEDKCVRVYYLATSTDQPLKVFSGHGAKVFHVRWSPLREGILCSGSDDGSIRIWDYTQETCIIVLKGHDGPIRGLLWNTEVPYLLISGSWDYSIKIWDTRDGACVDSVLDHGADVYGLTIHPSRPFLLASSSRDSTVRLWSLSTLVQPIEMNIIAGKPWTDVLGSIETAVSLGSPPLLTGKASRDVKQKIEEYSGNVRARTLREFSKYFSPPGGTNNLWELVSVLQGLDDTLLSQSYSKGLMHVKHLSKFKGSEAQEHEMVKMSRFGGGIGAPTKEERIREAAKIHIRLGNIQRYCELMVELGEWEKALSVAPGVSMQYWNSLAQRYAEFLIHEESDNVIPYCVATGDAKKLVHFFTTRGQLSDAVLTAQIAYEGTISLPPMSSDPTNSGTAVCNGWDPQTVEDNSLVCESNSRLADWYLRNGSPVLAACCHLAVDDCQKAITRLIQGNELELAVAVGTVLGNAPKQTHLAIELLSRRCENLGKWDLAVDLLRLIPECEMLLAKCCCRCAASMDEINLLHHRAGLLDQDQCFGEAEKLRNKINVVDCVLYYLMSPSPETGLEVGMEDVKRKLGKQGWTADDIFSELQLLGCVRTDKLHQYKSEQLKTELMVLCAYIGALVAVRRKYDPVVPALFQHARTLMKKEKVDIPITDTQILQEQNAWQAVHKIKQFSYPSSQNSQVPPDLNAVYLDLLVKAGDETSAIGLGADCVASSNLPCHSDVHISYISGQRIQGLPFFLEDGRSAISINEALMWAKVNPFSPLGSGHRINPF